MLKPTARLPREVTQLSHNGLASRLHRFSLRHAAPARQLTPPSATAPPIV